MYVDDTNIFIIGRHPQESMPIVVNRAQSLVKRWCNTFWVSGGVLGPNKCWWRIIDFEFKNGQWKYKNHTNVFKIEIPDAESTLHDVKMFSSSQAMEVLGVWLAADGNIKPLKAKTST